MTPAATLRASLERHNEEFESLLNLIPARFYLVQDDEEQSLKYQKHKKNKKEDKQAIKEASKKAKKAKLDPANHKTIIDLQNEAFQQKSDSKPTMQLEISDSENEKEEEEKLVPMPESSGIEALRKKLHTRMVELRNRGQSGEAGDRDELLEERRRQRATMRERRRKETREKIKREEEMRGKKQKGHSTKAQLLVSNNTDQPQTANLTTITFGTTTTTTTSPSSKRFKTISNPHQALTHLIAHKTKLTALSSSSSSKRTSIETKEKWDKASARLSGIKIRDDEMRLKKAIKRKEKEKAKSKKAWDERKDRVVASMAAKQKKRMDHIAVRNERRRRKDDKKGKGKGKEKKSRPGFEGKSFGRG